MVDYLVDMNLVGKRVKKASGKDIYRPDYNKVVAEKYRAYER
jgi:hypothetical protein